MRYLTAQILRTAAQLSYEVSETGLSNAKKDLIQSEFDAISFFIKDIVDCDNSNDYDQIIILCDELYNSMQFVANNTTKKQRKSTTYKAFYNYVDCKLIQASEHAAA